MATVGWRMAPNALKDEASTPGPKGPLQGEPASQGRNDFVSR